MINVPLILESNLFSNDLLELIELKRVLSITFISIYLFHPRLPDDLVSNSDAVTRSDRILSNYREWSDNFIGKLASWIDLDTENLIQRYSSTQRFEEELSYAGHLGLRLLLLPPIKQSNPTNYAFQINKQIHSSSGSLTQKLLIPLPFVSSMWSTRSLELTSGEEVWQTYRVWLDIQQLISHSPFVELCLDINQEFIDFVELCYNQSSLSIQLQKFLSTWAIQPIRVISLPFSTFVLNDHGFPVLSRAMQYVIKFFMKYSISVMITGKPSLFTSLQENDQCQPPPGILACNISIRSSRSVADSLGPTQSKKTSYLPYFQYLRYLVKKTEEDMFTDEEKSSYSYFDVLQLPLQPLVDNLESYTYEVFEKDPVKYLLYEKSICKALTKLQSVVEKGKSIKVMVVGAGRGPLVTATLSAAHVTNIPVKILVIEKNPNAVVTLKNRMITEYWDSNQVSIVSNDMRYYQSEGGNEKYDLIISELLGSFGDNELSPECLYETEHNLCSHAISIPSCYTAYLQPISTPLLYMSATKIFCNYHAPITNCSTVSPRGLETPYVVLLKRFKPLADPLPCWSFHHPLRASPDDLLPSSIDLSQQKDTRRHAKLEFVAEMNQLLHGFAGYFDAKLFETEIVLSILPTNHSENMFSWFPIYFPVNTPIRVEQGTKIVLNIWRCKDAHRVWYEWCLTEPIVTAIHNTQGRSSYVGL